MGSNQGRTDKSKQKWGSLSVAMAVGKPGGIFRAAITGLSD